MLFEHLQITNRKERWLVGVADLGLSATSRIAAAFSRAQQATRPPERILLLRLERIGDLLMAVEAIALIRSHAPDAQIDLIVGSWNADLARLIPGVDVVETLDLPWMVREGPRSRLGRFGAASRSWAATLRQARAWRPRRYDLAINFEPDIRSNILLALSGAARQVGFVSGGGGAMLTDGIEPDPAAHVATNAKALAARAFGKPQPDAIGASGGGKLNIPDAARRRAAELMDHKGIGDRVLVGIQPAAGRKVKEWDPTRFAATGAELARTRGVAVILVGSASDVHALTAVKAAWPSDVPLIELPVETDLVALAAILERLSLFITGDTGPMHLAAAVGTPILAVFGPSLPSRYAPLSPRARIVRIDLPCSPCNRMRQPPERCVGIIPDCLSGIQTAQVVQVANEMLDQFSGTGRTNQQSVS
jgi:ADP-heptose:LPS heptosyltransferase